MVMMHMLVRLFVKDYEHSDKEEVRKSIGKLTATVGVVNNILLCIFKFIAGTIANSVSITADAINNLSDAGSSVISLISFRLSSRPADAKHPFGHERYEFIASLIVAILVLYLGIEMAQQSLHKILHPEESVFSWVAIIVLFASVLVKLWMFLYNRTYGKQLHSSLMIATAADSLSDALGTSAVLLSIILSPILNFNLDGYMGIIVAAFILYTGFSLVRSALDDLLGKAPDPQLVAQISERIRKYDGVLGIHDMIVHDYGPNRLFVSVHVEVDYRRDIFESHDMIDNIEKEIKEKMGIETVIHMDPIKIDDELTNTMRKLIKTILNEVDSRLTFHDFRIVPGTTHTNLIFDVVVPFDFSLTDEELMKQISQRLHEKRSDCFAVITFDRAYTSDEKKDQ